MALQDTLQESFSDGGFDLGEAVSAVTEAYQAVAPPGVDIDVAALGQLAGQISGTDPAAAFSSVTGLASTITGVLGGLGAGSDLVEPVTKAVASLGSLGAGTTDLRSSLVTALSAPQPGARPVDRFAAGTGALGALPLGALGDVVSLLAPGALPALPPVVTGWAAPIARVGGFPALATQLGLLLGGSTVVATAGSLAATLGPLADPAGVEAARLAVLALDGAGLAARIASGDPEQVIVADVSAGLAVLTGFTDAVNQVLIGGTQLLDVLDPAPLEGLLGQAVTAAGAADTTPVRELAEAVAGQLSVVLDLRPEAAAAATVAAFADQLAAQLAPLTAAITAVDVAKVAAPITSAVNAVLAPVRAVADTLKAAVDTIRTALEQVRTTIEGLGFGAVVDAVHTVIDPIVGVVDEVKSLLEPIAATLGAIAAQTSAAVSQLRTTLDTVVGEIAAAFQSVADAIDALHLDQLHELTTAMDEVASTIEGVQIGTAVDEAVGFIRTAADVVDAIPFDLLPESAKSEVTSALEPIKEIDFGSDVREPLSEAMNAALSEVEGPALDEISQAFAQVASFLTSIDPRPELAAIESEGFGTLVSAVQAIDPDVILAPIKEALSGLSGLKDLLAPADEAFDQLLAGLDQLDPAQLLDPIASDVDEVRAQILSALGVDAWVDHVTQACDRLLEVTELVHLADVLDMPMTLLDELWPPAGSQRDGLAGAQLVARMLGPDAGPLDVLSFSFVGEWISGHSGPAEDLATALGSARSAVVALRAHALALDPSSVLPSVGPAFDQIAAAVAALPAGTLKSALAPLVATSPVQLLQPAVDFRGVLLARLDTTTSLIDRLAAVAATGLANLAGSLRSAFAPISDALKGFASSWVARVGADPGGDLRAALALVFTTVADRLRPDVAQLESAIRVKLAQAVDVAVRAPLTQAATDVHDLVATIDLRPLSDEVEAVFLSIRGPVAALKPSVALADLVEAIDGLVGETVAWDPFRDVRAPLNQMKADVEAAALELAPSALLAPVLHSYDTITGAVATIDVGQLFERTLAALHSLESDIEDGLAAAESAFGELQDALP